ncbi:MAG: bacillithiol biosynthesis cysteine-adding enzyme BshC [Rhodothermales bacterium]|nr:bacillithiol biosynthesis cysteine-adding enzyme BshC [Rhodothermales bacterium]
MPPTRTATGLRRLPFDRFRSFSSLFTTYCTDYDRLAAFYAGDWRSPEARRAAAERTAAHPRDHAALADVLLDQNARWGLDHATREHIEALRGGESVAVVTGQQVGLFGGPLYTPYKTITALQLAERLADEAGRPVVPIFWLEGGDHDLAEVASLRLLRHNDPVAMHYTGHTLPEDGNLGPVGRLRLTGQIEHLVERLGETLPPSDFHDRMMALVRESYRPGTTLLDAFARLLRGLFPDAGLVFLDPDDTRLKRLAAPLFRREIEDYEAAHAHLGEATDRLAEAFHAQVRTRPTNLFLLDEDGRHPLDAEGDGFRLRDRDQRFTRDDLLDLLDDDPGRFSPNVVLRPLMQDSLLPTAAYVGGPGEVAYFGQYKGVYEWAGVPMPIIYPRASVSLVESKIQKVLDRHALDVADLDADAQRLFQRIVVGAMEIDVEAVFKEAGRHLHEAVNTLKPQVEKVDRTLVRSAEATRAALLKEFEKLKARVVRAEKHQHEEIGAQIEKAQANLFPAGTLQERALSLLYFINKYGLDLPVRLRHTLDVDTSAHQVVEL